MVTKLVKNEVMPISSPAFSSNGREAVKPATQQAEMPGAAQISDWIVVGAAAATRPARQAR
jgi:hypothetical protein